MRASRGEGALQNVLAFLLPLASASLHRGQGVTALCLGKACLWEEIVLLIAIEVLKNLNHLDPGRRVVFNNLTLCPGEMSRRTEARNNLIYG